MNDKNIVEYNKLIANWMGLDYEPSMEKFSSDSNWQWKCLTKISTDINESIDWVLKEITITNTINSKYDLFIAIVEYIKSNYHD